ncbi:N-6 DNA methylase [Streptomyces sp. NPDC102395]|uniref:N-6 DNA methylase n=1 Tax=Streptomyces sp. NPDC102395 TaxID=3366168 RepID=UPI0038223A39
MANERITEDMVEARLRALGYYDDEDAVVIEKQQSTVQAIRTALSKASKTGKGGAGYPEFIITAPATPDMVVVVECKADVRNHESAKHDLPAQYAVDGVLHYARYLSPNYTVIAVAVSGDRHTNKHSFFVLPKGVTSAKPLVSPTGAPITEWVGLDDLLAAASFDPNVQQQRTHDLIAFSMEMHEFMRDEAELEEKEKPLAVAGTLIALNDPVFAKTYAEYPATELPEFWMQSIQKVVRAAKLPVPKIENMTQPFTNIQVHPELRKPTKGYPKGLLSEIVTLLADRVMPFLNVYHDFDVVGAFYGEFLKYTGGDGKGLGIVLTPRHVTELFSLLANVTKDDKVLDICAGTGGFLISAMMQMIRTATTDAEVESVKKERLIGIEQQATMYALATSNMILRGDGKANIYQGSCFDVAITKEIESHRANIGMINPPYAKSKEDLHELRFVEHMLDNLEKGGTGIAIVPVSCATLRSEHKANLMKKHTLEAVMSMPPELFHPVGVITCILVFTAGIPHATANKKTWFGYWRDDRFVKVKNLGRVDKHQTWPKLRDHWVEMFRNREVHAGESVMQKVGPGDEWVAEAYMETDYSGLDPLILEKVILDDAMLTLKSAQSAAASARQFSDTETWGQFELGFLFDIKKGKRVTAADRGPGTTRFIGASEYNNGITDLCDLDPTFQEHCLTVPYNGNSVGVAFYQDQPFFASDDVQVLIPKQDVSRWALLFVAAVIRYERYRFTYGYKWNLSRMKKTVIRLPMTDVGTPDWSHMERVMQGLPFSTAVASDSGHS